MTDLDRINKLEQTVEQQKDYIQQLERITEAYDNLEILTSRELKLADKTVRAQEVVQDLSRQERIEADKIIRAHEEVNELSRHEIQSADQLIHAQENVHKLSELERRNAESILKAQENLKDLSVQELRQRDGAIRSILQITRQITGLMDEKSLLEMTLNLVMHSLHAERGSLFLRKGNKLIPKIVKNISFREMRRNSFAPILEALADSAKTCRSLLKINATLSDSGRTQNISYVCLPLVYEQKLLGMLYLDLVSEAETFKTHDLEIAEIFSSQAAISLNNATLYKKIKTQNLELLKLINLKGQLIDHISEEIRDPLRKIFTTLKEIIERDEIGKDSRIGFLWDIHSSLEKLEVRVEKVMAFQELEKEVNDLFIDTIDFPSLLNFILEKHSPSIKEKNLTVEVDIPANFGYYHGNHVLIRTIFDEVISNAIFYNKPGGNVQISGKKEDSHLVIEIKDTGVGIDPSEQDSIFDQFYRIDGSDDYNNRGAGLGLFMVKSFTKHYNGDVQVSSKLGDGSTFTISLLEN